MAKSIRSKRKRKIRKVKRERYGKKEKETLKKLAVQAKQSAESGENEIYTVLTKDELQKKKEELEAKLKTEEESAEMETDQSRKFNKKTKRDEHGQYPVWMNQRAIHKLKNGNKAIKRKKGKPRGKFKSAW